MKRVCVFCGSSAGVRPSYLEAARALGTTIARRGLGLVYGGASVGLMGAVANAALEAGGEVIGVLPKSLQAREIAHLSLSELHVVDSMHTRKAMMAERADAFIALPDGLGTMEELFEVMTWRLIGLHQKPCGLLDVDDYYAPLRAFFQKTIDEGFLRKDHLALEVSTDADTLLDKLAASPPIQVEKWVKSMDET
ncbi:MAG: LOG family protein [Polyangiales bacterium]